MSKPFNVLAIIHFLYLLCLCGLNEVELIILRTSIFIYKMLLLNELQHITIPAESKPFSALLKAKSINKLR